MNKKLNVLFAFLTVFSTSLLTSTAMADKTVLAGGCFWCMESDFEKLKGVSDVVSGFSGGTLKNPIYNGNHKGHYEVVEITYDPKIVSYKEILDYYWVNIDPFDARGQFCDKGSEYLSAIFVANESEKKIAEESKNNVQKQFPSKKIVTPILDASTFWPIAGNEIYHQDYYKKSPIKYKYYRYSCGRDKRLKTIWGDKATVK